MTKQIINFPDVRVYFFAYSLRNAVENLGRCSRAAEIRSKETRERLQQGYRPSDHPQVFGDLLAAVTALNTLLDAGAMFNDDLSQDQLNLILTAESVDIRNLPA